MTALYIFLACLLILGVMAAWAYRRGREGERADSQSDKLEAIDRAKRAADAVKRDPYYADRVRDKYQRD